MTEVSALFYGTNMVHTVYWAVWALANQTGYGRKGTTHEQTDASTGGQGVRRGQTKSPRDSAFQY